jgi:hypothetical protein
VAIGPGCAPAPAAGAPSVPATNPGHFPMIEAIDFACTDDLDPTLRVISGARSVVESVYRELITPSAGLWWDQTRGLGLSKYLNVASMPGFVSQIASQCEACALNDDRVETARATVTLEAEGFQVAMVLGLNDGTTDRFTVTTAQLGSAILYG